MTDRKDVPDILKKYNINGSNLEPDDLRSFLQEELGEMWSTQQCQEIIQKYGSVEELLKSEVMDIFDPKKRKVYQDMSRPLCDYFIDSSHNTYLPHRQFFSDSKVDMYKQVLKSGCRVIEVDVHDPWSFYWCEDEPNVYHGFGSWTSTLSFTKVLKAVEKDAFEASEYPVILSLENHCAEKQQIKIVKHLKSILKDKLFARPLPARADCLPSPADLKGKFVLHVDSKVEMIPEFSDLVPICKSEGFTPSLPPDHFTKTKNTSDKKAMEYKDKQPTEWIKQTCTQLSRIYPSGIRVSSSNFDPVPLWGCGNQVLALNYQTMDEPMYDYKGFFQDNGGCGYILKPEFLRVGDAYDPNKSFPAEWGRKLAVRVISGFGLPKANEKRYIEIGIHGQIEREDKKVETERKEGLNPAWESEEFQFQVSVPELTMVRFYVFIDKFLRTDPVVGQYTLPFTCIRPGYRIVHLRDPSGRYIKGAQLFVHVSIET